MSIPKECNERTTPSIIVEFIDEKGDPVVPSAAWYRIDDHLSETEIKGDTEISGLDSSVEIVLTQTETQIIDDNNFYEIRRVTVRFDYGTTKHGNDQLFLKILNLKGITSPAS